MHAQLSCGASGLMMAWAFWHFAFVHLDKINIELFLDQAIFF